MRAAAAMWGRWWWPSPWPVRKVRDAALARNSRVRSINDQLRRGREGGDERSGRRGTAR